MINVKKEVKKEDIVLDIPIEVINKFVLLNKISIILLLEVYKLNVLEPTKYVTTMDFKEFEYARNSISKFLTECEKHELIKIFKYNTVSIILLNNEKGNKQFEYLKNNKNKPLWEIMTFSENYYPIKEKKNINKNAGYVYLLEYNNLYKIGCSKNIDKRLHDLEKNTPHKINLIHSIKTDNKYKLENELHQKYKDKRSKGEWFSLSDSDIQNIKNIGEI